MKRISIGIVGYGHVGRGVRGAIEKNLDMELGAIWTRRPEQVKKEVRGVPIFHEEENLDGIDVTILCRASKDLLVLGPEFARRCNTVDGFDLHAFIPSYFDKMNRSAKKGGNVSVISAGWDPGIFSLERVFGNAFLPGSKNYTFWGKGVSAGHSVAAKGVKGVKDARQYTIPIEGAIKRVRRGETPELSKSEMHRRLVYVVAEEGADLKRMRREIVSMPDYYLGFDTEVKFIGQKEMEKKHSGLPHGGFVLTSGLTGSGNQQVLEYRCKLESNPEFTGSVLVAYARAAYRLNEEGRKGAFTVLDIPASYLSPSPVGVLRKKFM